MLGCYTITVDLVNENYDRYLLKIALICVHSNLVYCQILGCLAVKCCMQFLYTQPRLMCVKIGSGEVTIPLWALHHFVQSDGKILASSVYLMHNKTKTQLSGT